MIFSNGVTLPDHGIWCIIQKLKADPTDIKPIVVILVSTAREVHLHFVYRRLYRVVVLVASHCRQNPARETLLDDIDVAETHDSGREDHEGQHEQDHLIQQQEVLKALARVLVSAIVAHFGAKSIDDDQEHAHGNQQVRQRVVVVLVQQRQVGFHSRFHVDTCADGAFAEDGQKGVEQGQRDPEPFSALLREPYW